ncbi:MAG: hypothetical protein GY841_06750, partial [FCB group bacterium]|nr:hypothetical protein [FCB group bacterium]
MAIKCGTVIFAYDDNMHSYMVNFDNDKITDSIYIGNHYYIEIFYLLWGDSEPDYDVLEFQYSYDGQTWFPTDHQFSGDYLDWDVKTMVIPDYPGYLFLKFLFISDEQNHNYWGACIDNVLVTGHPRKPNLAPTTPSGWSGPIVASAESGDNTNSDLYDNQPTYVDFAVANTGSSEAGPFAVLVLLDDTAVYIVDTQSPLPAGAYAVFEDIEMDIGQGEHTLRAVIDCFGQVNESAEDDNSAVDTFFWDYNTVVANGDVYYLDLNPGGTPAPARNIKIELWDHNDHNPDLFIDSARTDDFGHFTIGPVSNYDSLEQDRLDVYVKVMAENEGALICAGGTTNDTAYNIVPYIECDVLCCEHTFDCYFTTPEESGPFYIIDKLLDGYRTWDGLNIDNTLRVDVILNDSATSYWQGMNTIFIDTSDNQYKYRPDTFDEDVILHEYGHKLAHDFDHLTVGGDYNHWWFSKISKELAAQEAFGNFWSCFVQNSNFVTNKWNYYTNYRTAYLENGVFEQDGTVIGTANDSGSMCEGAVAGMMWDIYDNNDDDQDGDGVGDYIDNDAYNLLEVLTLYQPRNSDDLFSSWLDNNYGQNPELWAVWF